MLSSRNISKINDQIAEELRNADRPLNSHEDKMAALERIAKLKSLLSEQTPQSIDYDQLAIALIEKTKRPTSGVHPFFVKLTEALARR